jgi:hypothetical protein
MPWRTDRSSSSRAKFAKNGCLPVAVQILFGCLMIWTVPKEGARRIKIIVPPTPTEKTH